MRRTNLRDRYPLPSRDGDRIHKALTACLADQTERSERLLRRVTELQAEETTLVTAVRAAQAETARLHKLVSALDQDRDAWKRRFEEHVCRPYSPGPVGVALSPTGACDAARLDPEMP